MTFTRRTLLATAALALSSAGSSIVHAQPAVKVGEAWARPTVQGQSGGGGFLKITGGAAPDRLVSARAGISKSVELHTMEMDGNVMRMREVPGIDVPAGATVELKPGGRHVMFLGLTRTLKKGDSFPLVLRFEKAGEIQVDVKVMTTPADAAAGALHKH